MWEQDHKEDLALKNWCFWTAVLEKILGSPSDCKEVQPVHPKGNQSWIFTGGTDAEANAPILKAIWWEELTHWKRPYAGKDWSQEEKGTTEDEMAGWHHRLDGHEFEQAPGVGDGQGSLVCCSLWGHKGSDTTERRNWTVQFSQDHLLKRLSLLSIVYSCLICHRLGDHRSMGLLLGFLFCSVDLNYNELSPHTGQNSHHKKIYKQ